MHIEDALRYPWADGEAGTTLVIGGILALLGPFVLPALVVLGYGLRVVEAELDEASTPPSFGDWWATLVDGGRVAVVLVGYVLVPFVAGTVAVAAVAGALGLRMGRFVADPTALLSLGGVALATALLLVAFALALLYVAPAAVVQLARTGRLGAAFAFDDVGALVRTDAYASAWLLAAAVLAAEAVVLALLDWAAVGVVLGGFVGFYGFVATSWLYARGAREAGVEYEATAARADEPEGDEAAASAG